MEVEKNIIRHNGPNFTRFGERHKSTDSRNSADLTKNTHNISDKSSKTQRLSEMGMRRGEQDTFMSV